MVIVGLAGAVVVALVVVSIFVRRHGESEAPSPGWTPTDEVFKDPGTGRVMRVWVDRSGERHYVPELPSAPPHPAH